VLWTAGSRLAVRLAPVWSLVRSLGGQGPNRRVQTAVACVLRRAAPGAAPERRSSTQGSGQGAHRRYLLATRPSFQQQGGPPITKRPQPCLERKPYAAHRGNRARLESPEHGRSVGEQTDAVAGAHRRDPAAAAVTFAVSSTGCHRNGPLCSQTTPGGHQGGHQCAPGRNAWLDRASFARQPQHSADR
jgi:hypothetical protein